MGGQLDDCDVDLAPILLVTSRSPEPALIEKAFPGGSSEHRQNPAYARRWANSEWPSRRATCVTMAISPSGEIAHSRSSLRRSTRSCPTRRRCWSSTSW
jgi:hypothetical protein